MVDVNKTIDNEEVCGEGCIKETFRIVKGNEIRPYGGYITKRFVIGTCYNLITIDGYEKID